MSSGRWTRERKENAITFLPPPPLPVLSQGLHPSSETVIKRTQPLRRCWRHQREHVRSLLSSFER